MLRVQAKTPYVIIKLVKSNRLALIFFAAAILFSMLREWNAPTSCARAAIIPTATASLRAN
jgi:hypothetical protein